MSCFGFKHLKLMWIQDKYDAEIIAVEEKLVIESQECVSTALVTMRIDMHHFGPETSHQTRLIWTVDKEQVVYAVVLLRRLALVIPTFLGITILIFAITRFVPGGPVERMLSQMQSQGDGAASMTSAGGNTALSDEQIAELNAFYGLDKPVMEAYVDWLSRLVTLDLGESTRYYEPVSDMIAERLPVSLFYGGMTFFISYFISIPLGYYKALKHGSVFDSTSSILIFVGYALPGYVVGVLLITLFSYHLEWFPMGGFVGDDFDDYETFFERAKDVMWHAVLPLICYLIGDFATLTMTMKNNLMENLSSDYIRTAIAKACRLRKRYANTRYAIV